MSDDDLNYLAKLQAALTPDVEAAVNALCAATPGAADEEIGALLRDSFPELLQKNGAVMTAIGLYH
jgi:hypothetical protein